MATDVKLYRVFISSPGDMTRQRNVIKETVANLSATYERKGITLSAWLWEEDANSEFGETPQAIITKQLGRYDLYIGIMGARFGSPTGKYGSGTEQEFLEAFDEHKNKGCPELAFYFKTEQMTSNMSRESFEQIMKVVAFKEKIGPLGLYREFSEDHELSIEVTKFITTTLDAKILRDSDAPPHQYVLPTQAQQRTRRISKLFYQDFLNKTGEDLNSGMGGAITLDQIWVEPELRLASEDHVQSGAIGTSHSLAKLSEAVQDGHHYLILGGETTGKTSLCKRLFLDLFEKGYFPIFLDGRRINSPDLTRFEARVRLACAEQYENVNVDHIDADFKERQAVIIDDFDLLRANSTNAAKLLNEISNQYLSVVITASPAFAYGILDRVKASGKSVALRRIEILQFGKLKRYSLVDRWCSAGSSGFDEENLRASVEEKRRTVDRMLSSNLVPRTPLVILILLRAMELGQASDLTRAGYIRYYKFLIDSAILKNISRYEAEGAYALLPEVAWAMYSSSSRELDLQQIERVIDEFSQRRALRKTALYGTLGSLRAINMFDLSGGFYKFRFNYTFYFFLADYISKNLHRADMQEEVRRLCSTVCQKESTDILVFLAFHTESPMIVDTLIQGISTLYPESPPFDLSKERNSAINKLIYEMPKQVVDYTKAEERRAQHLVAEEIMETNDSKEEAPEAGGIGPFEGVTTTVRTIEILGHIIRNHYMRLDAEPKIKIIEAATGAILRCLGDMFDHLSKSVDAVVTAVRMLTDKLDREANNKKKQDIASNVVFLLAACQFIYFGKTLARAMGDENLELTYQSVLGNAPQAIREYLDVLIKLDCFRQFPLREVRALVEKIQDNQLGMISLRHAVMERLDMRPPSKPADLQRFCDAVGLEVLPRLVARGRR